MGFGKQVAAFRAKALENASKSINKVIEDLTMSPKGIVDYAPILKGVLLNSWYPAIGNTYDMTVNTAVSGTGEGSKLRITALLSTKPFLGKDNIFTITNNQDYAYKIEYSGWSRTKRPDGWVRIAVQNIKGKYS